MRAVVLVGGFGTRLRPLTNTTPKPLLPVVHVPIVERVVGGLARHGVTDAVLALGFRPDAFFAQYPDDRCAGVDLHYAVEREPLDTAGAIAFAAREVGINETFIAVNGDVLTDLDLSALVALHRARGAEGTIALTPVEDPSAFGVVPTNADDRVTAFIEKPAPGTAPTNLINAGTYVLEPAVLRRIEIGRRVSIERVVFPAMVADGSLYAGRDDAYWLDTGNPDQYLQANLDYLDGRRGPAPAAVAAGAFIDPDAVVTRSVIGPGARIAAGARVTDSVVLAGAVIGHDAELVRTLCGRGALVNRRARLVDVVLGDDVVVAVGGELTGVRVPEPA
jgi:mannose-1-phosphate guanylyltransferase